MASLAGKVAEAGARLGLSSTRAGGLVFGLKDGYPVQLAARRTGNHEAVVEIIRYDDPARDTAVLQAIYGSGKGPFKATQLRVGDGLAVYEHPRRLFRSLSAETIAAEFESLFRAVKGAAPAPPAGCRECRSSNGAEPILLNGVVDRVCPTCIERLQQEAKLNAARYESLPMNMPLAVVVAAVLAVASAGVWAAIAIATNRMFWAIAVGSGLVIGWGTTRAAGKGGLPVQLTGALFTVLAVLLGEVFFIAWLVNEYAQSRGANIDWNDFAARVPGLLWDSGADTLFALGGGLLGAWYAIGKASKPNLAVSVERVGKNAA